jgi:hypothetical protein
MKVDTRWTRAVLLFLLLVSGAALLARPQRTQSHPFGPIRTGNDLYEKLTACDTITGNALRQTQPSTDYNLQLVYKCFYADGYLNGVMDVYQGVGGMELPEGGVSEAQVETAVVVYLKTHPEMRGQPAAALAMQAFKGAFPPKNQKTQ